MLPGSFAFGRTAEVLDESTGRVKTWTLVGSTEANLAEGKLSIESPVGQGPRDRPSVRPSRSGSSGREAVYRPAHRLSVRHGLDWPELSYESWSATCDTLHAHTQVLGKLAVELAPPEPQLQHAALRLTARGWETELLPAPDGSGAIAAGLDLRTHEAFVEHSDGKETRIALTPNRPVAEVTREVLEAVERLAGQRPDQSHPAGGALGGAAGRGHGARDLRLRSGRHLLHRREPGGARPRRVQGARFAAARRR